MLVAPLPTSGRLATACLDLMHAPLFALVAVVLFVALRRKLPRNLFAATTITWILAAGLGLLMEMLQAVTGRSPTAHDAMANALGAGAGALWAAAQMLEKRGRRVILRITGSVLLLAALAAPLADLADFTFQWLDMPVLASFERPLELSRWMSNDCRLSRVRSHASDGSWALRVDLEPGKYPGPNMIFPWRDWSQHKELVFDVTLDDGPPLPLVVKVVDREHDGRLDDRFHAAIRLTPGHRTVRIPLAEIAAAPRTRRLDLAQIVYLQLFTIDLEHPRTLHLDGIRLR